MIKKDWGEFSGFYTSLSQIIEKGQKKKGSKKGAKKGDCK
jgi:hypothetical protein